MKKFLLYGATGYTAGLILRFAQQFDIEPIIAGRDEAKIAAIAKEYSLQYVVFALDNVETIAEAIAPFEVVLHCAGPFIHTAAPMMQACMSKGVHYLDITGEIAIFEKAARWSEKAKAANVMLMPGTGFDVVPTDCMAAYLKQQMPDATHLELAFAGLGGGLSQGTALTMVEGLGEGGAIREAGKIVKKPLGHLAKTIPFLEKPLFCMTIPWGDVSTSFHTTAIPNIMVFTATNPKAYKWIKLQKFFNWFLKLEFVKNKARAKVKARPAGPSDQKREKSKMQVWGKVTNAEGKTLEANWLGLEGYTFTALSALHITREVLNGNFKTGFQTPAGLYGADLVFKIDPNSKREK
jgi:short subunit dehydrogenase-like uncharacterized protein